MPFFFSHTIQDPTTGSSVAIYISEDTGLAYKTSLNNEEKTPEESVVVNIAIPSLNTVMPVQNIGPNVKMKLIVSNDLAMGNDNVRPQIQMFNLHMRTQVDAVKNQAFHKTSREIFLGFLKKEAEDPEETIPKKPDLLLLFLSALKLLGKKANDIEECRRKLNMLPVISLINPPKILTDNIESHLNEIKDIEKTRSDSISTYINNIKNFIKIMRDLKTLYEELESLKNDFLEKADKLLEESKNVEKTISDARRNILLNAVIQKRDSIATTCDSFSESFSLFYHQTLKKLKHYYASINNRILTNNKNIALFKKIIQILVDLECSNYAISICPTKKLPALKEYYLIMDRNISSLEQSINSSFFSTIKSKITNFISETNLKISSNNDTENLEQKSFPHPLVINTPPSFFIRHKKKLLIGTMIGLSVGLTFGLFAFSGYLAETLGLAYLDTMLTVPGLIITITFSGGLLGFFSSAILTYCFSPGINSVHSFSLPDNAIVEENPSLTSTPTSLSTSLRSTATIFTVINDDHQMAPIKKHSSDSPVIPNVIYSDRRPSIFDHFSLDNTGITPAPAHSNIYEI